MDVQTLKVEIVKRILELENEDILSRILKTLSSKERDFWLDLTTDQKEEIEISRKQILNGEIEDWESIYKRLK